MHACKTLNPCCGLHSWSSCLQSFGQKTKTQKKMCCIDQWHCSDQSFSLLFGCSDQSFFETEEIWSPTQTNISHSNFPWEDPHSRCNCCHHSRFVLWINQTLSSESVSLLLLGGFIIIMAAQTRIQSGSTSLLWRTCCLESGFGTLLLPSSVIIIIISHECGEELQLNNFSSKTSGQ